MPFIDHIFSVSRVNLTRLKLMVADLSDDQMVQQPAPGMNHPAWILGHLSLPRFWLKEVMKLPTAVSPEWVQKFNYGTKPIPDKSLYPAKPELLAALDESHALLEAALRTMTEADLDKPTEDPRVRQFAPEVGDRVIANITTHEAFHLGQLSARRRAMGLPPVF